MRHDLARHPRGATLVLCVVLLFLLFGMASLAVDFAGVQYVRSQARLAVDAAARDAAGGLQASVNTATQRAKDAAQRIDVGGEALVLSNQDIEFGTWDPSTKQFEVLTGSKRSGATAVRVTGRLTEERNRSVPLAFGRVVGFDQVEITVEAIATRGEIIQPSAAGAACPWLAGMPDGSRVKGYGGNTKDTIAPQHSPEQVKNLPLIPGTAIMFRQTSGTTTYTDTPDVGDITPDGDAGFLVRQRAANGINATRAPIMALMGIFLDDRRPDTYGMAAELDFSTASSRSFTEFRPKLKQVFFIGDGLNDDGVLQRFIVPEGATRFYLGIMDEKGWWHDNEDGLTTNMLDEKVKLVK